MINKSRFFSVLPIILFVVSLALTMSCASQKNTDNDPVSIESKSAPSPSVTTGEPLQEPNVSSRFYPGDKAGLKRMVESYIDAANPRTEKGVIAGLISPHAGYIYSGSVAAFGFKLLRECKYKTVIILAPTHNYDFFGFAAYDRGNFLTPLGKIPVDSEGVKILKKDCPQLKIDYSMFVKEHSLEVQLPFLQSVLRNFKIIPIIIGTADMDDCRMLARAIKKIYSPGKTLIVASSDMSHYHPYKEAVAMDDKTMSFVEKMDTNGLIDALSKGKNELCGGWPIITTMLFMKEIKASPLVLKYANSGDTSGVKDKVVGYFSVAFFDEGKVCVENQGKKEMKKVKSEDFITASDKDMLLSMARKTLEEYLKTGKVPDFFKDKPVPENLKKEAGMFVTLHKNDNLRGCIGYVLPRGPLFSSVVDLAISSATRDPRFPPVKYDDLKDIHIEISVMSPLKKVENTNEIVMGKHGVYVKKGFNSGLFLPQVATETGWDKETFMAELCRGKAGLPANAWKDKNTEIYIFTADIFGEEKTR